ncbi:MAG: hypothetical protein ABI697_05975 [Devosia sp.]
MRTLLLALAAAAMLSASAVVPGLAQGTQGCLSDQQIQAAIASGKILSWPKIKRLASLPSGTQELSDVKVCMIDGVPYYTVNVVSQSGEASKIVLNAVDGSS